MGRGSLSPLINRVEKNLNWEEEMKTKLKNFLQSNTTIFLIALFMGVLCHYFAISDMMTKQHYNYEPITEHRGQTNTQSAS